jgi:L-iditol 2-dehydrogenase
MGGREGPGFFRDYAIMPVRNLELVPETITPIEAVLVEPVGVIVHMMKLAPVRLGDTVLVVGAGPIGLLTVVLSKLAGAAQVIAGDRVPHRVDMAKRMGADIGVQMPRESIVDAVMDLTRRRGADIIYDAVGSSETIDASLHAARRGAQYVLLGLPYEVRPTVDVHLAMEKEIRIVTVRRGNHSGHEAMALIESGKIPASLITHRIPLEATPDAFAMLAAYRDGVGKIVIEA